MLKNNFSLNLFLLKRYEKKAHGQAMIETILALSILLFSAMAIMQISHLIYSQSRINHAVFIATRSATITENTHQEILINYKKALGKFQTSPIQLEIRQSEKTAENISLIKMRITQGYRLRFPLIKSFLLNIFSQKTTQQAYEKNLLKQGYLPLHAEITLPLPTYIPAYSNNTLQGKTY